MLFRLEFKRYVILQMRLPHIGEFLYVDDTDSLEDALRISDRQKGMLVFEIPKDARMPDGANYSIDTDKIVLHKPKGIIN